MKKFFLLLALILIFSVSGCQKNDKKGCEPNPCEVKEHSTGVCEEDGWGGQYYICECEENYFWDPRKAEKKCVDPCEGDPCSISGSTGVCTASGYNEYECECEYGFVWEDEELKCIDLCDPNPCDDKEHSTGVCEKKERSYVCECEENYFWVSCSDLLYCNECVNPCLPNKYESNPCGNPETLKECIPKSGKKYTCVCKDGFRWNGVECVELNECSPGDSVPCKDSSTGLLWSTKISDYGMLKQCGNFSEGHFSNWETPSIDQLRTLIRNCPDTETGGTCEVSDECIEESCYDENCKGCAEDNSGKYSLIGDYQQFLSKSTYDPGSSCFWAVSFISGAIETVCADGTPKNVRCTRCLEDDHEWNGTKCVKKP